MVVSQRIYEAYLVTAYKEPTSILDRNRKGSEASIYTNILE